MGLGSVATPALALPFSIEGTLSSATTTGTGNQQKTQFVCNGVTVVAVSSNTIAGVPATVIVSSTGPLTHTNFSSTTNLLPNNGYNPVTAAAKTGFIGGSCIVDGDDTVQTADSKLIASRVFVEIAENVLVGTGVYSAPTGASNPIQATILGVTVRAVTDARMKAERKAAGMYFANGFHFNDYGSANYPAALSTSAPFTSTVETIRNQFGFGVTPSSITAAGNIMSAVGYMGTNGHLYAHTIDTSVGSAQATGARVSIMRAQCQNSDVVNRDQVQVRGGCILPTGATRSTVRFYGGAPLTSTGAPAGTWIPTNAQVYGTAPCIFQETGQDGTRYGRFVFAANAVQLPVAGCPTHIVAEMSRTTTLPTSIAAPAAGAANTLSTTSQQNAYDFAEPDVR